MFLINAFDLVTFPHDSRRNYYSDPFRHHLVSVYVALRNCTTMALVDFYQPAVLHKPSRYHAGSPADHSHPGSMPAATQTSSRSPAVEQDQTGAPFPRSTQPVPKMPKWGRGATQSAPHLTPASRGTPIVGQLMHAMVGDLKGEEHRQKQMGPQPPRVLYAQDAVFGSDSTHGKVASLFDEAGIINGEYKCERRTLRIIFAFVSSFGGCGRSWMDIAQVLFDVTCGTCFQFVHWSPNSRCSSLPMAVRTRWDSAPGPEPEQHHVSGYRGESLRGVSRF